MVKIHSNFKIPIFDDENFNKVRRIHYKKGRKVQPNLLEYTGKYRDTKTEIQLFVYDKNELTEWQDVQEQSIVSKVQHAKNNWLNIHGLNDLELIKNIGTHFGADHFLISDILNTTKRTKLEENSAILFFNVKSLLPKKYSFLIESEQISFILKDNVLISFQEKRSDFFTHIRERLRTNSGIVREKKVDYLLYLLLDAIIENFYITIENEEDQIDDLVNSIKTDVHPHMLEFIERHRDNLNFLKRSIIPLRDSLYSILAIKEDDVFNAIAIENYSFFSRLHQKCIELLEQIEADLMALESTTNYFFSVQNHKMNQVMKTLTVFSVVFLPLTFIVGVYGMNFENMPELKMHNAYFITWIVMLVIAFLMFTYFKWKKWF